MMRQPDVDQDRVTRVYDRIAGGYDVFEAPMDWLGGRQRRRRVLANSRGTTLEVGIGTGRNLHWYPAGVELTGIDVSGRMLVRARHRAEQLGVPVRLERADVQRLPFADASFDTVTATCVFCSVADPVRGLAEIRRVVRPEGQVLLLEHVRPRNALLGWCTDVVSPLTRRLIGPSLNRRTEDNVAIGGLEMRSVRRRGVWREIVAGRSSADTAGDAGA